MKYIVHMKDEKGKTFPYALNANDLTEADERAKKTCRGKRMALLRFGSSSSLRGDKK